jgi:AraC-like DNA-binding protein
MKPAMAGAKAPAKNKKPGEGGGSGSGDRQGDRMQALLSDARRVQSTSPQLFERHYGHALIVLLAHELNRLNRAPRENPARGGLSGWRKKRVAEFIEEHLTEVVRVTTLAALVDLSPYHFVRVFRQSFGVPPHRYHIGRRIERAKTLLAEPGSSVTDIARALGFAETSTFSATFRRTAGISPSQYRRGLG